MEGADEREMMLTPLYIIKFMEKAHSPEVDQKLMEWGLVEKVSSRSKTLRLTKKGLHKALESSIVIESD